MKEKDLLQTVHKNHRQRVKERFLEAGLVGMHDHEILELLLFYAIPRRDVNPLAHALMDHFGSLSGVFDASVSELEKVNGMGSNASLLISFCKQVFQKYDVDRKEQTMQGICLDSSERIGEYLQPHFTGLREEMVMLVCVDNCGHVLYCGELGRGSVSGVNLRTRQVVELAMRCHAHAVILAHNHPRGNALPSQQDITLTQMLRQGLRMVEIKLIEHIIFAEDDYISMHDSGML